MNPSVPSVLASGTAEQWLGSSWVEAGLVALSGLIIFATVILFTRIVGLRSFSKMSSFDFAMTVAVGSLMASTATSPSTTLLNGVIGLGVFYLAQLLIARARLRLRASRVVDNTPLLLMHDGEVLPEHMHLARISDRDLRAKLRQAGVTDPGQVLAVVLETTGDVSVLQGHGPLHPDLMTDVRGVPVSSGPDEGGG